MQHDNRNLRLALAFLQDAQHDLDSILATPVSARDPEWEEQRRAAMRYWARAYAHFRECHAASKRVALWNAA
jgi:hypothetical protein